MTANSTPNPPIPFAGFPRFGQLEGPRGIGGWLLLFAVGQGVALVLNAMNAADLSGFSGPGWAVGETISGFRPFLVMEELCAIVASVGGLVGLYLLVAKRPQAPTFYAGFLAFMIGYGLLEVAGVALLYPELIASARAAGDNSAALDELQNSQTVLGLRQMAYGLIWLLYWRSSRRVANTFDRSVSRDA